MPQKTIYTCDKTEDNNEGVPCHNPVDPGINLELSVSERERSQSIVGSTMVRRFCSWRHLRFWFNHFKPASMADVPGSGSYVMSLVETPQ